MILLNAIIAYYPVVPIPEISPSADGQQDITLARGSLSGKNHPAVQPVNLRNISPEHVIQSLGDCQLFVQPDSYTILTFDPDEPGPESIDIPYAKILDYLIAQGFAPCAPTPGDRDRYSNTVS